MIRTSIALAAFTITFLFSCGKTGCLTPEVYYVVFEKADSIPDTIANVVQYQKGSSFSSVINSNDSTPLFRTYNAGHKELMLGYSAGQAISAYDYDWMITLRPSGNVYKLANISHSNNKQSNGGIGGIRERCVNSVRYSVNGSNHTAGRGNTGSSSTSVDLTINY